MLKCLLQLCSHQKQDKMAFSGLLFTMYSSSPSRTMHQLSKAAGQLCTA